jgi:hypothetical protein
MKSIVERHGLIHDFLPLAEISETHETVVAAPASVVFDTACSLDLHSVPGIREIFTLREKLLGSSGGPKDLPKGFVAETLALGWGRLAERPGRELVMGSVTRPWEADVVFTAVDPALFPSFREPGFVKIAWTLEAEPIDERHTRFRTQTRAQPTDEAARRKFRRYWRKLGVGIILIRWLTLFAVRRKAERRFALSGRRTE